MPIGPHCPDCKQRVPLARTQLDLGTPFICAGCGTRLVVSRGSALLLGFSLMVVFWLLRDAFPAQLGGPFGLFALIVVIGAPVIWAITPVKRAAP
ncbi:hypothetical protein [Brevundimonas sp.]|uniref:hypothetical protein n=1 Tax=Brevundimonas sp. TaxID=1871086 RepID=UPI003F71575E